MSHAHKRTAQSVKAHPSVIHALADAIVEIIVASVWQVHRLQRTSRVQNWLHSSGIVAECEAEHDK
jgi:hypothetical protein